jgi:hypothetical protein
MDAMIPAGYMYKQVAVRPDWLTGVPHVEDIYSLSGCISDHFCDYTNHWRHNDFGLFNDPSIMTDIASVNAINLSGMILFYYEVYEQQFDAEDGVGWSLFEYHNLPIDVLAPKSAKLEGYDIACYSVGSSFNCSPMSCNGICQEVAVNKHCLFDTLEQAKAALDGGKFEGAEWGPYRIFAVYTVELDL